MASQLLTSVGGREIGIGWRRAGPVSRLRPMSRAECRCDGRGLVGDGQPVPSERAHVSGRRQPASRAILREPRGAGASGVCPRRWLSPSASRRGLAHSRWFAAESTVSAEAWSGRGGIPPATCGASAPAAAPGLRDQLGDPPRRTAPVTAGRESLREFPWPHHHTLPVLQWVERASPPGLPSPRQRVTRHGHMARVCGPELTPGPRGRERGEPVGWPCPPASAVPDRLPWQPDPAFGSPRPARPRGL